MLGPKVSKKLLTDTHLHGRRFLDEPYTLTPYEGVRRMTVGFQSHGSHGQHTRVARLLHTMGIEAISPTPRLRPAPPTPRVDPY
jgi:putative transposase